MKVKPLVLSLITTLSLSSLISSANACTRILWQTEDHGVFVSRTMDWSESTNPYLANFPQGSEYTTHLSNKNLVTSKFAVTGITAYGVLMDGINSQGLSGNILYDGGMDLGKENNKQTDGAITYLRHMLSQHQTVNDVVKAATALAPNEEFIEGIPVRIALHLSFQDPTGDSAIIEWREGKPQIWHGKQYTVMTNQPGYAQHLANIKRSARGWGEQAQQWSQTNLGTGGNTNPEDRFVHATYFSEHLKEPTSIINGILKLESTMFRIPHDAPNRPINGKMAGYATEYSVNRHLQSGETYVRYQWGDIFSQFKYNTQDIQKSGKMIFFKLSNAELAGNITEQIINSGH
ncbi:linear amide C-N hydrolase [Photobacterium angustum]|uniref:linear amide C-N hydrolase n=1 Tax=Photobacterium angustum TaxID=661 RepID=UPI0005DDF444|nr:linear amide C-N hydrolase [Photobacterium angustum]KJG18656.1 choloylglycine hydrolase [Photobacterium angustum]KJG25782.1 choloylglycine hydrolase [Photobacterium angustum]KJG33965.1 choloylglycine hydrolase [Photobacterium angustum]PSW94907.1 linear amide C-N hydrolase [Photobacterium angustum]PSX04379.1 linear amide C-N hydrolase [Photobacterium angustum]